MAQCRNLERASTGQALWKAHGQAGLTCSAWRKPRSLSWMQPTSRKLKVSSVTAWPFCTTSWEQTK